MAEIGIIDMILTGVTGVTMFLAGFYISQFIDPIGRAKILTTILRKPHGIIWFVQKNDELEPHVVDFNKNRYEDRKNARIFVMDNVAIYRQGTIRHQFKPSDDANDTLFLKSVKDEKGGIKGKIQGKVDPNLLNVVIEQLKIIAEQKAMLETKELKQILIGVGVIALIGAGLAFEVYDKMNNNVLPDLGAISNGIKDLAKLMLSGVPRG